MSKGNIEDFYPLSPAQQGILFHSLYQPESDVYFGQLLCVLRGDLNVSAFRNSWQKVVDRHPILRTCFVWENVKEPVQVVRKQAPLSWQQIDWRSLSTPAQAQQLENFLKADREQGFDLTSAPLIRVALAQLQEDAFQFILSHHHLVFDGWSLAIVLKEVFAFYEAECQGAQLQLKRPRSYRDYIAWLQQQDLAEAESFWRQTLQGFTTPTSLVVGGKLSCFIGEGSRDEAEIKIPDIAPLQELMRQYKLTINTLVQGAWALLLSRYSGEEDIIFGVTVSGRSPELIGVESMVGMLINTLPVRVSVSAEDSIISWLQQLQNHSIEVRQYEYSPLVEIQQRWSKIPPNTPLFESIVVFENYPVDPSLQRGKSDLEIGDVRSVDSTNYPIALIAIAQSELELKIMYDRSRFEQGAIARMLGHLQVLLEGMAANPHQPLKNLPLLTPAEKQQILVEWNGTKADYPQDRCIHQLFEAQVDRTPDAIAVVFEDQELTYRELNTRANQVAHYLQKLGVKPEVLVGICVERSPLMVIGLLGVLKAGGAYVPLDPNYPKERLAFMLEDSSVQVLLAQEKLLEKLPPHSTRVVCLDSGWEEIAFYSSENPRSGVKPENLAYVIYTSGSTGKPKGVLIEHRSLVNYTTAAIAEYGIEKRDRVLQFASISFDASAEEIYPCLTSGATLVLRTDSMLDSAGVFLEKCRTWNLTVVSLPTAYWHELTALLSQETLVLAPSLRLTIIGGEKALPERLKTWIERVGQQVRLVNTYGPTEATVVGTICELSAADAALRELPIGRPIGNVQTYILDCHGQPVPTGIPGELHLGGAGLARGYLNRPELTAEKFIPSPFSNEPGSRLYKTGDLTRYRPDGNIEYVGRIDNQVKIRGFRIELAEIEAVLSQHPAVRESAVLVWSEANARKRLVAYVVPDAREQNSSLSSSELRQFLQERLPEYMVPSAFVLRSKLPLTPNGKLDRRALPQKCDRVSEETAFTEPQTPTEKELAQIWMAVLEIEKVGINESFFDIGGHSLMAMQLVSRVRMRFGVELPLYNFYAAPTIQNLAELVEEEILANADSNQIDELLDHLEKLDGEEAQSVMLAE
ncbi:amino acid adenylation domain-containing protein [Microcoleus sp. OTE_8_concoct_300]|uniref:amino acid adenylation domain-containing protein n=1 Tax=Microcoleus sp. OTE_8_concoct_300 TaxID=2964710 RepID=UPI00403EFE04